MLFKKPSKEDNKNNKGNKTNPNNKTKVSTPNNNNNEETPDKENKALQRKKEREARRILNKEVNELLSQWRKIMLMTNTYNSIDDTFEIFEEEMTNYGWRFKLYCSYGLNFDQLEKIVPTIRDNLKCSYFLYEVVESREFAVCDVIYSHKLTANSVPFEPVKVNPWEVYCGVSANGEPIVGNMITHPHIFIAGQTRRGKNGSMNHILTTLIHCCTPEQVQILYYQGAKGDGGFYKNCKHVYAYAQYDLEKLLMMLQHVEKHLDVIRPKLFQYMTDNFLGDNLYSYNKLNPNNQLPYIYVVIDEYLECTIKKGDSAEVKKTKYAIESILTKIAQYGGSLGITYIISHQKPERELCPTFLKNMSNTRICFGYDDNVCSRIVLGDDDDSATGLPPRRAIYKINGKRTMLFTTNLDGKLAQYLKPHQVKNKRTLFEDLEKQKKVLVVSQPIPAPAPPKDKEATNKILPPKESIPIPAKEKEAINKTDIPKDNANSSPKDKSIDKKLDNINEDSKLEDNKNDKNIAENIEKTPDNTDKTSEKDIKVIDFTIKNEEIPSKTEDIPAKIEEIQLKAIETNDDTNKKDAEENLKPKKKPTSNLNKVKTKEQRLEEMLKIMPDYVPFDDEEAKLIEKIKNKKSNNK